MSNYQRIMLAVLIGFFIGGLATAKINSARPVCHAATEDSIITDCAYHDGGWYQEVESFRRSPLLGTVRWY